MPQSFGARALVALGALVLAGCVGDAAPPSSGGRALGETCNTTHDCASDFECVQGRCAIPQDGGTDGAVPNCDGGSLPAFLDPCGNCPMTTCCLPGQNCKQACAPEEGEWACGDGHTNNFFCTASNPCCAQVVSQSPAPTCPITFVRKSGTNYECAAVGLCQSSGLVLCPFDTTTVCGPLGKTCTPVVIDGLTVGACL